MHHRLGNATVTAGFSWEKNPKFPTGEIPMGQYSCKKKKGKKSLEVFNQDHLNWHHSVSKWKLRQNLKSDLTLLKEMKKKVVKVG